MIQSEQFVNRMCVYTSEKEKEKETCEFMNHTHVYDKCFATNSDPLLEPVGFHKYIDLANVAFQSQLYNYIHSVFAFVVILRILAMFSRRV